MRKATGLAASSPLFVPVLKSTASPAPPRSKKKKRMHGSKSSLRVRRGMQVRKKDKDESIEITLPTGRSNAKSGPETSIRSAQNTRNIGNNKAAANKSVAAREPYARKDYQLESDGQCRRKNHSKRSVGTTTKRRRRRRYALFPFFFSLFFLLSFSEFFLALFFCIMLIDHTTASVSCFI